MAHLKIEVITCDLQSRVTPNYDACTAILKYNNLKFDITIDRKECIKLGRDSVNPVDGMIVLINKKEVIHNCMQLARWISEKGLVPAI